MGRDYLPECVLYSNSVAFRVYLGWTVCSHMAVPFKRLLKIMPFKLFLKIHLYVRLLSLVASYC